MVHTLHKAVVARPMSRIRRHPRLRNNSYPGTPLPQLQGIHEDMDDRTEGSNVESGVL